MIDIPPAAYALAAAAFLLGLLIGRILWGGARARADRLSVELVSERAALAEAQANRLRLERDVAASRDQVKPLADEVDRLKRENARLTTRAASALPVDHDRAIPVALPADPGVPADLLNLRLLKGVGDKLAARLGELGVRDNAAMAALSPVDAARIDGELAAMSGRIARDHLIEQARLLAEGRVTEFEARFGRLEQ